MQLHSLLLNFDFVPLVVRDVASIQHPEVQVNIEVKRHFI